METINELTVNGAPNGHTKQYYYSDGDLAIKIPFTFWGGLEVSGNLYIYSNVRISGFLEVTGKIHVRNGRLTVVPKV